MAVQYYGQRRDLTKEQQMATELRGYLEGKYRQLGRPLQVSAQNWSTLVNAAAYGGYSAQDIFTQLTGGRNIIHPEIAKSAWSRAHPDYFGGAQASQQQSNPANNASPAIRTSYGDVPSGAGIYDKIYKESGIDKTWQDIYTMPDTIQQMYQNLPKQADIENKIRTERGYDKKVNQLTSYDTQIDTLEKTIRNAETSVRQQYAGQVDENRLQRILESQLKPLKTQYTDLINTRNNLATVLQNEDQIIKDLAATQWADATRQIEAQTQKYGFLKDVYGIGTDMIQTKYGIAKEDRDIVLEDLQHKRDRGEALSDFELQLQADLEKDKGNTGSGSGGRATSGGGSTSDSSLHNAQKATNAGGGYNFTATVSGKSIPITMAQYANETGADIEGLLRASRDPNDAKILNDYLAYKQSVAQYPDRQDEFYQRLVNAYPHVFKL